MFYFYLFFLHKKIKDKYLIIKNTKIENEFRFCPKCNQLLRFDI